MNEPLICSSSVASSSHAACRWQLHDVMQVSMNVMTSMTFSKQLTIMSDAHAQRAMDACPLSLFHSPIPLFVSKKKTNGCLGGWQNYSTSTKQSLRRAAPRHHAPSPTAYMSSFAKTTSATLDKFDHFFEGWSVWIEPDEEESTSIVRRN